MQSDEEAQDPMDRWAELLAEIAMGLIPDLAEASAVLLQAATIVALKYATPMECAEALLATAEDHYARTSAAAGGVQ